MIKRILSSVQILNFDELYIVINKIDNTHIAMATLDLYY